MLVSVLLVNIAPTISCTCSVVKDEVAANVIVSELALVVIVIPLPAASVKVSAAPSATTSLCPDTEIVLKASEATPPVEDVIVNVPAASS